MRGGRGRSSRRRRRSRRRRGPRQRAGRRRERAGRLLGACSRLSSRRVAALTSRERLVLLVVLVFTALAGIARYADAKPLVAFGAAAGALAGPGDVGSFSAQPGG